MTAETERAGFAAPPFKTPGPPIAYSKICFLCIIFRTTKKITGENRANMVPSGDSLFDFPSGEIEHPPPPPPLLADEGGGDATTVIFTVPCSLLASESLA